MSKPHIVAVVGMEHYNEALWREVHEQLEPSAKLSRFTEFDLQKQSPEAAQAIRDADCVFMTMLNFKTEADWLREQVLQSRAKTVFAFESMPEVMSLTKVGDYNMAGKAGMPEGMKKVARMLVGGREEDTLYGFTKLMKLTRVMLRFIPERMHDFKNWMQVNIYWNQPETSNIVNMFRFILREYFGSKVHVEPASDVPLMGLYHPDAPDLFHDLKAFRRWRDRRGKPQNAQGVVGLLFFRKHLLQDRGYINDVLRALEARRLYVYPVFVTGIESHVAVREWLAKEHIDALVSTIGFALVGGPAGSTKAGQAAAIANEILSKINAPYIVTQPLYVQDFEDWREHGVGPMQSAILYSVPEMDGAISPIVLGALKDGRYVAEPDRLERLADLTARWVALRRKPNSEKRIAIVAYDFPPGVGKKATAALLDVPSSILAMLQRLKSEGYNVGELPPDREALLHQIDVATDSHQAMTAGQARVVTRAQFREMTTPRERERLDARWGSFPGEMGAMGRDAVFVGGLQFGNIYVGIQPRYYLEGDPMRLLFDKENVPPYQYLAFYRYVSRQFRADAMIHVGMHGSAEWMPGLQLGMTSDCWPDALLGELPHLYLYPSNNPSEANLAKRRGYATMISHAVPPLSRAGLYKELLQLNDLLSDYRERVRAAGEADAVLDPSIEEAIMQRVALANIDTDCPRIAGEAFATYASRLYAHLHELQERLITGSLHVFGEAAPLATQVTLVTEALKAHGNGRSVASLAIASLEPGGASGYAELSTRARKGDPLALELRQTVDRACQAFVERTIFADEAPLAAFAAALGSPHVDTGAAEHLREAADYGRSLKSALGDNRCELDAIARALSGGFIAPAPGGDLIRDGASVMPTGRNLHAIDPWRIPSEAAYLRGSKIGASIVSRHLEENGGIYPETIAQVLWGLDTIKTKGEAVATVMHFIGARPAYDGQGKIGHYELIPLAELGRPRIDVVLNLSPVFRDTFEVVMDYLDKVIRAAAAADEPLEMNFIKKHVEAELAAGTSFEDASARVMTQAPGSYGTYVDDMVDDSAWKTQDDLESVYLRRNSYAYGNGRHGQPVPQILDRLLGTVGRVVQEIDSIEFGISDIDHYFSSSGALYMAAKRRAGSESTVKLNYVESFTAETTIRDVDQVLRMEYRTKLLNPRWYEGMLEHGNSGAAEISNRFTYMLGWDAVTSAVDDWVWNDAAQTFALDDTMRERLQKLNPGAMKNIAGRLLEANGRGLWKSDEDTIARLKSIYEDCTDRLEGAG
jgi:magnesium chelatase subunit H